MPPDPFAPPRPTWLTVAMVAVGVLGAPPAILGLTLLGTSFDVAEGTSAVASIGVLLGLGVIVASVRAVRPLGVGMLLGSLALGALLTLYLT